MPDDEPVVLVGFSLGAMVALGSAAALPDRIRGLVLVEPAFMMRNHRFQELPIADLLTLAYVSTRTHPSFEGLVATCRTIMPDADEGAVLAVATQLGKIDPEVTNPDVLDRALDGVDLGTMLEGVKCPILVFRGDPALGALIEEHDVAWARQHARDVDVVHVPGAGHDIPLDIVVEHGREFLDTLASV